jgi:NADH:ubiquinone oxidoreductase subunit 5 (subunit L)/multisubunit Na+/H+ antiporter MnhA subunit
MIIGSLSLTGWPFLSGFYSKDAILEAAWSHGNVYGTFAYITLIGVASFTSYYTFRRLWCSFVSNNSSRQKELPHSGLPFTMSLPLIVLSFASLGVGYLFSDALIGVGTTFWNGAIQHSVQTTERFAEHMMPSSVLFIPLLATVTGALLTAGWSWPMPWVTSSFTKYIYLFFLTRWQFDFVANQQVAKRVLDLGAHTWAFLDKGVLELLGPHGLTVYVTRFVVPSVRHWQTGIVHDYALILKIFIRIGLSVCLLPTISPNILNFYDSRTLVAAVVWFLTLPF